jgi:uncharacterized secreted protein with C-terminal beta-propeller domain
MQRIKTFAALAAVAVLFAGCSRDDTRSAAPPQRRLTDLQLASSLRRFDSCDALRAWAREELAPRVGAYGFSGGYYPGGPMPAAAAAEDTARASGGDASGGSSGATEQSRTVALSPDFSGTNVQVEGVDEPDIVKTDGKRIVSIVDGKLRLASAETSAILDTLTLPDGMYDAQLLLGGDRILVVGTMGDARVMWEDIAGDPAASAAPQLPGTRVVQVDVAGDRLKVSDTFVFDGTYISARMTDDVARLVLHADPQQALPFVTPAAPGDAATERAQQMNREVVEQASAEDLLPHWRRLAEDGTVAEEGTLVDCAAAHAPNTFSGFGMVTVVSVDLSEGLRAGIAASNAAGVMAGGQIVYASPEHLYVAAPEWVDYNTMSASDALVAAKQHGTDIHRFDISDPRAAKYEMSGHVEGDLVDQFAMDEQDGNLRVATTTGAPWETGASESESQVVVLAPKGDTLTTIGHVGGLGRGETIQSVRFLGSVGYVVTFRQTDPLYTIDLSDPTNPHVAGELKILGFSAYLHPVGDGKLLGIGQDATESGRQLGTQVALFDVSDPANPTRVAQATLPNASSGAEWDHHAFLWWSASGLAAIPVSAYEPQPFEGLVGFTVDTEANTITERGRVTHPAAQPAATPSEKPIPVEPGISDAGDGADAGVGVASPPWSFPSPILRSFVIGDRLWTLSSAGLATSDLATLGQTTFVAF